MLPLISEKTQDTPGIILSKSDNKFEFTGTSMPENTKKFYQPVFDWLEEYIENPNDETIVNFKMVYFNTSSTKSLLDIMDQFKHLSRQGNQLIINWYFAADDDDMLEAGKGFSKMVRFPFNYIKQ